MAVFRNRIKSSRCRWLDGHGCRIVQEPAATGRFFGATAVANGMATITPTPDGPYKVEGAKLLNADGDEVESKPTMFLCRCGQSANKPFCDGTHKKVDFKG